MILPLKKLEELYPDDIEIRWNLNPLGLDIEKKSFTFGTPEKPEIPDIDWCDILFTQNISNFGGPYTLRIIQEAKARGKITHWDTDDLLTDIYEGHRLKKVYVENGLEELAKYIYATADLVTVTQKGFADRIAPYALSDGGILVVLKNLIDYSHPIWNLPKIPPQRKNLVRVGWVGGIHHDVDVKQIDTVFKSVNQKVGLENVEWGFYGKPDVTEEKDKWQLDVWAGYERMLTAGLRGRGKNYRIFGALPTDTYGKFFTNIDIAIAPLEDNSFNASKSEIKLSECGKYKVPLIATDVGCYNETIRNWENGVLIPANNPKSIWINTLVKLIKNKGLREKLGQQLHDDVIDKFDLGQHVVQRLHLYQAMLGMDSPLKEQVDDAREAYKKSLDNNE